RQERPEGASADQKTTQTTLSRRPTSTRGSDVARSSSRSGGASAPADTGGGSVEDDGPKRSQAPPTSAAIVITRIRALIASIRRRRVSVGSSMPGPPARFIGEGSAAPARRLGSQDDDRIDGRIHLLGDLQ